MIDWYKIKRILVWQNNQEKQIYPAETVQTFDFQNDGALWWTTINFWYWVPSYTSWQWWGIWASSWWYDAWLNLPASAFNWQNLKEITVYMYKPRTTWTSQWNCISVSDGANIYMWYSRIWVSYGNFWYISWWNYQRVQTIDPTWEVTLKFIFNSDWSVTFSVNWTESNVAWIASDYTQAWLNWTLRVWLASWNGWTTYMRKVVITTKP